jgi:hypothetical protein
VIAAYARATLYVVAILTALLAILVGSAGLSYTMRQSAGASVPAPTVVPHSGDLTTLEVTR